MTTDDAEIRPDEVHELIQRLTRSKLGGPDNLTEADWQESGLKRPYRVRTSSRVSPLLDPQLEAPNQSQTKCLVTPPLSEKQTALLNRANELMRQREVMLRRREVASIVVIFLLIFIVIAATWQMPHGF